MIIRILKKRFKNMRKVSIINRNSRTGGEGLSDQNKVVKFKKRRNINIGIIVFLILFLYIAINVFLYLTKNQLSIYEVHEGSTAVDNHITGLILREEEVIYSQKAGYISYFLKEGARVAKNSPVYSVDETGQIASLASSNEISTVLSKRDHAEIKHEIRNFRNNFSDSDFSGVYSFKEDAQSTVLDIINSSIINQSTSLSQDTDITYSLDMVQSEKSGVISFYTDSYEAVTPETVTDTMFEAENYKRTSLRTTEMAAINTPIYKLVTSETWHIMLPLTQLQYEELAGKEKITITVLEDDFTTSAALKLEQHGSSYYAQLTLDKYLTNYLEDRFIDIELNFDTEKGLKVPLSALVEKDFYLVPLEFFSLGAESQKKGLIVKEYGNNGEIKYSFAVTDIYYDDGAYGYVDTELFGPGTDIKSATNSDEYTLSQTAKLIGVYNVNLGYAVFKRVEILNQNEEYCIIKDNTTGGLSAYDQIALDGSTAVNQAIIY